jgi:hypothetical protein
VISRPRNLPSFFARSRACCATMMARRIVAAPMNHRDLFGDAADRIAI